VSWTGIETWIREHAPVLHSAFLPPASAEDIAVAEAAVGRPLPADLALWWRQFGGVDRSVLRDDSPLLPLSWHPVDVAAAICCRETSLRTRADWSPEWLPIAVDCFENEDVLFVDLRDGSVVTYEHRHGAYSTPEWAGVSAMLAHLLRMFEHNDDPVYQLFRYTDGHLTWEARPTLTQG
jgi:cell wall assembly regulator SMI1